jgi:hypothetical protein
MWFFAPMSPASRCNSATTALERRLLNVSDGFQRLGLIPDQVAESAGRRNPWLVRLQNLATR